MCPAGRRFLVDLNANGRSRLKHHRFGEGPERAITVGDAQPGNVVNRFALIFTARVAHVEAVEEAHLFRAPQLPVSKIPPERPGGELIEREVSRNQIGRIGIESEAASEICAALF